jgi:hypothetical protein
VKKLNLQDIESIAEVIGAIAIVVSLIYVGIQVNDSALATRSATANDTSAAMSNWYIAVGSNPDATRVLLDGMTNPASLRREETAQFIYLYHALFLEYQTAYYVAELGTLDIELRDFLVNTLAGVREQPGFLMYRSQRREIFKPSFRDFVDDLIAQGTTNKSLEQMYQPKTSQ